MNDSIKGVVEGKCPECGWERKVSSLTPPTATLFCKECDYQGASELWTTNAQAQVERPPMWPIVKEKTKPVDNTDNSTKSFHSRPKNTASHELDDIVKADTFRSLPDWFFLLAFLNLFASFLTAALLKNGYLVIYGIGSMLTCLAFGRVIELLQNIDDELYRKRLSESP